MNSKMKIKILISKLILALIFITLLSNYSFGLSASGSSGSNSVCATESDCGINELCINGFCVKLASYSDDKNWSDDFSTGCGFGTGLGKTCHPLETPSYKKKLINDENFYVSHGPAPYYEMEDKIEFCDPETTENCNFSLAKNFSSYDDRSNKPLFYPTWSDDDVGSWEFYEIDDISEFELNPSDNIQFYVMAFRTEFINKTNYTISFLMRCNTNSSFYLLLGYLAKDLGIDTRHNYFSALTFERINITYNFTSFASNFYGPWVKVNFTLPLLGPAISIAFHQPEPLNSVCIIKDFSISKPHSDVQIIPIYDDNFFENPIKKYIRINLDSNNVIVNERGVYVYRAEALIYNKSRTGFCKPTQCYVGHCVDNGTIVGFFDNHRFALVCDNGTIMPYVKAYNRDLSKETYCPRLGCLNDSDQCVDAFTSDLRREKICFAGRWYDANVFIASLIPTLLKPYDFRNGVDSNTLLFCTHQKPEKISHFSTYQDENYLVNVGFYCEYMHYNSSADDFDTVLAYFKNSTSFSYYLGNSRNILADGSWMYVFTVFDPNTFLMNETVTINGNTYGFKRYYDPNYLVEGNQFYFFKLYNLPYELFSDDRLNTTFLSFTKYLPIALYNETYDLDSDDVWKKLNSTLQSLINDKHLKDLVDYNFTRYENNPYFKTTYTIMAMLDVFDHLIEKFVNLSNRSLAIKIINYSFSPSSLKPYLFGKLKLADISDFGFINMPDFANTTFYVDFNSLIVYDDYNIVKKRTSGKISFIYLNVTNFCNTLNSTIYHLFQYYKHSVPPIIVSLDNENKTCLINWGSLSEENIPSESLISWMSQMHFSD